MIKRICAVCAALLLCAAMTGCENQPMGNGKEDATPTKVSPFTPTSAPSPTSVKLPNDARNGSYNGMNP